MMWTTEFKVGFFVLVCMAIIAAMSLRVNNDPSAVGRAQIHDVLIPNASGIVKQSNVKMAGIPVGLIKDIQLENGMARVVMSFKGDLKFTKSAAIEVKPNGILGDKFLEIYPGDPKDEPLGDGERIQKYVDKGSFDAVLNQVGKIAQDISEIADGLKKATTGEGDDGSPIGRILHNIEDLTADLRELSEEKKEKLGEIIDNVHEISENIKNFVGDESEDGFKTNWKKMAKSLGRVDSILRNVDEIIAKINNGKGTLGKLVNDETTVEELNHAIASVNNYIDTANKFQINLDYHSEFLGGNFTKTYVGLAIQPGPDRYYLIQVIDDPKGSFDRVDTSQTVNGGTATVTNTQNVYHNKLKISAEFAKTFHDLTLRGGIIESAGGAGIDYTMFNKKLRISAEAFNFSRSEGVDVRVYARYKFYSFLYGIVGGDDILNTKGNSFTGTGAAGFIGAGLDFTNDDLKVLLTKVPF